VGGCAQLRWSATGMRSVSSALLLAKRLRAAALVGDQYAFRYLGAAACEAAARSCAGRRPVCGPFPRRCCLRSGCAQLRWSATGMRSVSSALLLAKRLRAAALVGDQYAVRFLGAAACEAAARSCAGRRPVCGPFPRRCCLRSGCAQLRWSATGMRSVSSALLLAKRQQHLEACRCCSLLGFSPRLRPGRKTKDASRSVTCAAACLGCESMWRCSGLMPRAALCLEGHWVKMRPGAAVMAHPRRRMAVGCHRPRAQRGTSCCAVTGASSAALRGGKMLRLLAFFPRTLTVRGQGKIFKCGEGGSLSRCGKTRVLSRRPLPARS